MILPVHNQGEHIAAIVTDYLAVLRRLSGRHELILVTNACTDGSVEVCRSLAAGHEPVQLIDLLEGGWGRAVKVGLERASGMCSATPTRLARQRRCSPSCSLTTRRISGSC